MLTGLSMAAYFCYCNMRIGDDDTGATNMGASTL